MLWLKYIINLNFTYFVTLQLAASILFLIKDYILIKAVLKIEYIITQEEYKVYKKEVEFSKDFLSLSRRELDLFINLL